MGLNRIFIQGRLTRDPELRHTQSGTAVASFSVAVDRAFKDKTTGKKETDFIDCVAWRHTGEFVQKYFSKGSMAVVVGRLQMRDWTDKDGNKRRSAEIVVEDVYFGGDSHKTSDDTFHAVSGENATAGGTEAKFEVLADNDSELPF